MIDIAWMKKQHLKQNDIMLFSAHTYVVKE